MTPRDYTPRAARSESLTSPMIMPDDSTFSVVLWVVKKRQILLAPSRVKVSSSDLVGDLFPMVAMKLSVNENQVALWKVRLSYLYF